MSGGLIDRDELLGTTMLGKGYYKSVLTGHVQNKLTGLHKRVNLQYESGRSVHMEMWENRNSTNRAVVKVSDRLGSANFPDLSIWNQPHRLIMKAYDANHAGDVLAAKAYLVFAALAVEYNGELLADYTGATIAGGKLAVKILKVAETAGKVAEVGLTLVGIRKDYVKLLEVGATKMLKGKAKDKAIDHLAKEYAKKLGISKDELSLMKHAKKLSSPKK